MQNKFIYAILIVVLAVGGFLFYRNQEVEVESKEENVAEVEQGSNTAVEQESVSAKEYTMTEVAKHNTRTDCWAVINGSVYGLTEWISKHPGGADAVIQLCGKDGSSLFNNQHGEFAQALEVLAGLKIGVLTN